MAEVGVYEEPQVVYDDHLPEDDHGAYEAQGGEEDLGADQTQQAERKLPKIRMTGTPAPGQYHWNDHVNKNKKPVWSMQSPERKNLDSLNCTWTPMASNEPRAPDPTAYGNPGETYGARGKHFAPAWTQGFGKSTTRPCFKPPPAGVIEIPLQVPSTLCGACVAHDRHPPKWSVMGKDRSQLSAKFGTWTPVPNTDVRPGPGTYDVSRRPKKASSRRGTMGGRQVNLHPFEKAWVPKTFGAKILGGEYLRFRPSPEAAARFARIEQMSRSQSSPTFGTMNQAALEEIEPAEEGK